MALQPSLIRYPIHLTALKGRSTGEATRYLSVLQLQQSRVNRDINMIAGNTPLCTKAKNQSESVSSSNRNTFQCRWSTNKRLKSDDVVVTTGNLVVDFQRWPLPKRDELAKAVNVFDNPYFYDDDLHCNLFSDQRQKVLGDKRIKQVFEDFTKGETDEYHIEVGLKSLGDAIGATKAPLLEYFRGMTDIISVEQTLYKKKLIALTSPKDVDIFQRTVLQYLPSSEELQRATMTRRNSANELDRALDLALVLGSSGSGKTFFALEGWATEFLLLEWCKKRPGGMNATLHIYPKSTGVQFFLDNQEVNPEAATDLCSWIKKCIWNLLEREVHDDYKFDMHMCIIFDEAGDLGLRSWFESKRMLEKLCQQASLLAESVAVVVVGNALSGQELSSKDDAYVFRMTPWSSHDFRKIIAYAVPLLSDDEQFTEYGRAKVAERVANAVFAHPKLGALATNARLADFLSEAIARLSKEHGSIVWRRQLDSWAPSLVTEVVEGYVSNSLKNLKTSQRRRVAASIFHALKESTKGKLVLPTFEALRGDETAVAHSLAQYNLEYGKDKVIFVGTEKYAVTITPAMAILLYAIAGIPTNLMPAWKAEEMLVALYATRQLVCACMETFLKEVKRHRDESEESKKVLSEARARLDQSLERIEVLALHTQVKAEPDTNGKIYIPIVGASTVMLNGDKAPFADVMAPYTLIRAKQVPSDSNNKPVDMLEELGKCRLLKGEKDIRVLQGLVKMWRGDLEPDPWNFAKDSQTTTSHNPQSSRAFPENLFCLPPPVDRCSYATIEQGDDNISFGGTKHLLPQIDDDRTPAITFMLSTNSNEFRLQLSENAIITISEKDLDADMALDPKELSSDYNTAWTRFLRDRVRKGIEIKFLFTKSWA